MNRWLYAGVAGALAGTGVMSALERRHAWDAIFILMLHRVLPRQETHLCYNPHLTLTPEALDAFLAFASTKGELIGLEEALDRITSGRVQSKSAFVITFDDGWEDNHRFAFPVLRKHRAPTTVFLATSLIGSANTLPEERFFRAWEGARTQNKLTDLRAILRSFGLEMNDYERSHQALKRIPMERKLELLRAAEDLIKPEAAPRPAFMDWKQVRELAAAGIEFGAHTCSHAVLQYESANAVREELRGSRSTVEAQTGRKCRYFAYPNGIFTRDNIAAVKECGFAAAVSTISAPARDGDNVFALPRVSLDNAMIEGWGAKFSPSCCRLHLVNAARSHAADRSAY